MILPAQRLQFLDPATVGNDLQAVAIFLSPPRLDLIKQPALPVAGAAVDGAVHGLKGGDVFVRAEVLPISASGELFRVVVNGDAQGPFAVDDRDSGVAGAVGGFGE